MAKMRVHELAKELDRQSKEIITLLQNKGIEVKNHMTTLEDDSVEYVKKSLKSAVPVQKTEIKAEPKNETVPLRTAELKQEPKAETKTEHEETHKKKKNIIFVSNPHNSKVPGSPLSKPIMNMDRRPNNGQNKLAATENKPEVNKSVEAPQENRVQQEAKPIQTTATITTATATPTATPTATSTATPTAAETPTVQTVSVQTTTPVAKPEQMQNRPQEQNRSNNYNNNYNNNNSGQSRPYNNNNAGSGGQSRPYNNTNTSGGQSRPYNNNAGSGGQSRPYNNTNGTNGSQSRPYNNTNTNGGQSRPYNNTNTSGGQSRPYNNTNTNGGQSRPYNNTNTSGGQNRPYNNAGAGGGQSRPYNNTAGQSRPYNNSAQGRPGYSNNQSRPDGGGAGRPPMNRPYNQRSPQGYNGAGGNNRPYNNNERFQKDEDKDSNRFRKPQASKPFSGDSPLPAADKHRDEERRRMGQEKDKRSRRDKIYEEEAAKAAKPGRFIKPEKKMNAIEEQIKVIIIPEVLTIKELAEKMKIQPSIIIKKLFLKGEIVTLNQEITFEAAEAIAIEYEIICEKEVKIDVIEELLKEEEEDIEGMTARPPVICVMGHVDHGKTSLLDAIRKTNVTDREAGGITQHIGAYTVTINNQKITFLDTPGHEAFTSMRMRGANATDIAILVVAADDGVMPQTVEAINHAKAAGIDIIVAVNKMDKPNANIERVKQELTEYELISEDWGGSTVFAPVSAKSGEGIEQLLEMILLSAEILELKANENRTARGLVIEAQLDKGRGPVATILVQKGTLHVGDFVAAGACHGKVRAMIDDKGRRVKEAGPSTPVEILGLNDVPAAGDTFVAPENDKEAKNFADTFISQHREKMLDDTKAKLSLDDLFSQIQAGSLKELNIIIKADVQGSVEAVKQSLLKLSNEEVVVKIIHGGVGAINESDVILASASQAIIIGFNVRPDVTAKATAEREGVDLRLYKVIYQAIEDVEAAMKGMLDPVYEEKIIGHAEVRQIFKASALGNIAGSYVLDGLFQRGAKVRISREGKQIFEGALDSLKRFKDDVKEVKAGYECGLVFEAFDQMQELDIVEAYIMVEVPR